MVNRSALKAIVMATTCLTPLAAFADELGPNVGTQYDTGGEFGIGVMGVVGRNSDQAGRYNGLNTTGVDAIGEFNFHRSSPWDSGGAEYYNFSGDNLVLQSGSGLGSGVYNNFGYSGNSGNSYYTPRNNLFNDGEVNLNFGRQGTWEGGLYYDAITYTGNVIDSIYSMNGNHGTLNNGFPAYGGATSGAAGPNTVYTVNQLSLCRARRPDRHAPRHLRRQLQVPLRRLDLHRSAAP